MKISKLTDIDLSQYKLAYFHGNSLGHYSLSQDEVMATVEDGIDSEFRLVIGLIPKKAKLTHCSGDDWDDSPAECNASGFYQYPKGTIFLEGKLGGELRLNETKT